MKQLSMGIKILIGVGAAVLLIVLWFIGAYNGFVRADVAISGQWAQVETQYQRRFDLIPNLVNSVKGIMNQEKEVFGKLADARSKYAGAGTINEKATAAGEVETALSRLLVVMENYPELRSTETVTNLMASLEGTENRVAVERKRYNDIIQSYNQKLRVFPGALVGKMFGFSAKTYFESTEGAQNAPTVDL
ncbi:MAG: LemA protein [Parcubacteria group bacterium GW2011_GWA2_44_12]|nr:MAG: LemA protein [Parcubacteria group bacterium GW2011_GWA2_44_12]